MQKAVLTEPHSLPLLHDNECVPVALKPVVEQYLRPLRRDACQLETLRHV
jgi:hypothetical protein